MTATASRVSPDTIPATHTATAAHVRRELDGCADLVLTVALAWKACAG
jgi:hypothetical protein